ncbi:MAG TPA: hypothetical protein VLH87_01445, partial [Pyrinomonadaceae bacterium]|nr:hypothetical protein [Pyrinomonadaceae bacterium]
MKTQVSRLIALSLLLLFSLQSVSATCGGGGGGGGGGMSGGNGGGASPPVYIVPWKLRAPKDPPAMGLILYWFPASQNEMKISPLRESRALSLYASQCVSMEYGTNQTPNIDKLVGESKLPVAVLANSDGAPVKKVENTNGKLKLGEVEKLVESEMQQRAVAVDAQMKDAADKVKSGDKDAAIKTYRAVLEQKCMFPKKAKEAAKQLKSLGATDIGSIPASPVFEQRQSARIEQTMRRGLVAEMNAHYVMAGNLYSLAHRMDPADPTPLRYLGENYRHNIGDWDKARATFEAILDMPADPLSRSVALHGLGKMTIHEGEFKKGLALMEQAVAEFPLALAYRNLAVYWNSEGDPV